MSQLAARSTKAMKRELSNLPDERRKAIQPGTTVRRR